MNNFSKLIFLIIIMSFPFAIYAQDGDSSEDKSADSQSESVFVERADIPVLLNGNPKDVFDVRRAVNEMDVASNAPIRYIPSPESDVSEVHLIHNEDIPVIYLMAGNPTTVEFTDITGAPWSILQTKSFSPFVKSTVTAVKEKNSAWLKATEIAGEAIVSFYLKDLNTVVSIKVVADGKKYHRSKVVKIMKIGANTKIDRLTIQEAEEAGQPTDEDLLSASYGIRPNGYRKLDSSHDSVIAWEGDDNLLIYTSLDPMIPDPIRIKTGAATGWRAYRLPKTTRITLTNEIGNVVYVTVSEPSLKNSKPVGEKRL